MRLQDIMSKNVKTIAPDATVSEARARMRNAAVHHLIVVDHRQVVGVVSERDLGGRAGGRNADVQTKIVADVMSDGVVSAGPQTTVRQAANRMRGRGVGCLAVLDDDRLLGIVTTTDLLELIGRGVERPIERSEPWTLRGRGRRGARPEDRQARRA
jgi:acetoin utilization protein AcuB